MAFIVFLALKNTPLAFLTAYSYERINQLHQIGGYTTVIYMLIHLTLLSQAFMKMHKPYILLEEDQIYGMVAGCAMFLTLVAAVVIRRIRYELFYVLHVSLFIVIVVMVGFHRPHWKETAVIVSQHFYKFPSSSIV